MNYKLLFKWEFLIIFLYNILAVIAIICFKYGSLYFFTILCFPIAVGIIWLLSKNNKIKELLTGFFSSWWQPAAILLFFVVLSFISNFTYEFYIIKILKAKTYNTIPDTFTGSIIAFIKDFLQIYSSNFGFLIFLVILKNLFTWRKFELLMNVYFSSLIIMFNLILGSLSMAFIWSK